MALRVLVRRIYAGARTPGSLAPQQRPTWNVHRVLIRRNEFAFYRFTKVLAAMQGLSISVFFAFWVNSEGKQQAPGQAPSLDAVVDATEERQEGPENDFRVDQPRPMSDGMDQPATLASELGPARLDMEVAAQDWDGALQHLFSRMKERLSKERMLLAVIQVALVTFMLQRASHKIVEGRLVELRFAERPEFLEVGTYKWHGGRSLNYEAFPLSRLRMRHERIESVRDDRVQARKHERLRYISLFVLPETQETSPTAKAASNIDAATAASSRPKTKSVRPWHYAAATTRMAKRNSQGAQASDELTSSQYASEPLPLTASRTFTIDLRACPIFDHHGLLQLLDDYEVPESEHTELLSRNEKPRTWFWQWRKSKDDTGVMKW
ncbi:hypothetical protein FVE85_9745 [Porphyridium purpureum]|uniref:Uncharacterized protein n=1 Tax=Porphyridium purpureum TaxID=35688 RepID=A0A5J4YKB3_PORPP|nr:hypothetical protein FVE85_9745 [Porphyridium purpureum]|eukprot:POR8245..scf246_12